LWVGIITGVGRAFCTGADLHGRLHSCPGVCAVSPLFPPSVLVLLLTRQQSGTT
jgi:enoyl-CoA hydratase/carnithine racemase